MIILGFHNIIVDGRASSSRKKRMSSFYKIKIFVETHNDFSKACMFRGGRSGTHTGSIRIYSGFGFSGLKILVLFGYF